MPCCSPITDRFHLIFMQLLFNPDCLSDRQRCNHVSREWQGSFAEKEISGFCRKTREYSVHACRHPSGTLAHEYFCRQKNKKNILKLLRFWLEYLISPCYACVRRVNQTKLRHCQSCIFLSRVLPSRWCTRPCQTLPIRSCYSSGLHLNPEHRWPFLPLIRRSLNVLLLVVYKRIIVSWNAPGDQWDHYWIF